MNSRPWPAYNNLAPINVGANTESEIQQVFGTLNSLIAQFNSLVSLAGGIEKQINYLLKRIEKLEGGSVLGTGDLGDYLANGPSWSNLDAEVGMLGYVKDLGTGFIPEDIGTAAGQLVVFADVASATVFDPGTDPGFFGWTGAAWAVASVGLGDMSEISAQSFVGNKTADPAVPDALSITEVKALLAYTIGEMAYIGANTLVGNVTGDAAAPAEIGVADFKSWLNLDIGEMAGISPLTLVGNNDPLTSLAPADLSVAEVKAMLAYGISDIAAISANSLLGNNTGSPAAPDALTASEAKALLDIGIADIADISTGTLLGNNTGGASAPVAITSANVKTMLALTKTDVGLGNVENTALSTWAAAWTGSTSITTVGSLTLPTNGSITIPGTTSVIQAQFVNPIEIRPISAGGAIYVNDPGSGGIACRFQSGVTYPYRLVLPVV